jgi:hypothetical protein
LQQRKSAVFILTQFLEMNSGATDNFQQAQHEEECEEDRNDIEEQESNLQGDANLLPGEHQQQQPTKHISHFRNAEAHPFWLRWGIPLWFVATVVLLINSDIGSGVSADYIQIKNGEVTNQSPLFEASIFSSVKELWLNKSYPLAILIVITSIAWPYIKIVLSLLAWMAPFSLPRRREFLLEIVDALGKWSFVDIVVFVEIMVAFRSSIRSTPVSTIEIVIIPKWGFYGFVLATMMSLLGTHVILYYHRRVIYHNNSSNSTNKESDDSKDPQQQEHQPPPQQVHDADPEERLDLLALTGLSKLLVSMALVVSLASYLAGCLVDIFEVKNTTADGSAVVVAYSVVSVGQAIPTSSIDETDVGIRWLQAMWFFLCVAMPLWCSFIFGLLYLVPLVKKKHLERVFLLSEIAFSWSCAEVFLVSTIFAVLQLPTFGEGLIESGCIGCYVVDSKFLPGFPILVIGTICNVAVNIFLYRKAHHALYSS